MNKYLEFGLYASAATVMIGILYYTHARAVADRSLADTNPDPSLLAPDISVIADAENLSDPFASNAGGIGTNDFDYLNPNSEGGTQYPWDLPGTNDAAQAGESSNTINTATEPGSTPSGDINDAGGTPITTNSGTPITSVNDSGNVTSIHPIISSARGDNVSVPISQHGGNTRPMAIK